jgi:hypothetical protein
VRISPGIHLTAEENLRKETVNEGCATSTCFKWGPVPLTDVGRIAHYFREREDTKEGNGGVGVFFFKSPSEQCLLHGGLYIFRIN